MSRKTLIRSASSPYHVTARCNNREPFHCSIEDVWFVFNWYLNEIVKRFGVKIHAFVLMPNHFHLLISTPKEDLGIVMQYFMLFVTKTLNEKSGRSGRVFGNRYHWSVIDHIDYFDYALKYVYRNPVKAGLANNVENYSYSTIRNVLGHKNVFFPIHPPLGIKELIPKGDKIQFLRWMNQPFRKEHDELMRKGFKKRNFKFSKKWKTLPSKGVAIHHNGV